MLLALVGGTAEGVALHCWVQNAWQLPVNANFQPCKLASLTATGHCAAFRHPLRRPSIDGDLIDIL